MIPACLFKGKKIASSDNLLIAYALQFNLSCFQLHAGGHDSINRNDGGYRKCVPDDGLVSVHDLL